MIGRRALLILTVAFVGAVVVACAGQGAAADGPLILISLDGWRADYLDRGDFPNLRALAARGVRSEALIPAFPSKTFPNHYTAVTGLYPDHHGIVSNTMTDPAIGARFTMSAPTADDPRWWGGEPLWATAKRQGRRAASMFWPGSEVPASGQPADWKPFDNSFPNDARVRQVIDWLARPPAERPAFITLYFSDVDSAGHDHGPDAPETLAAAASLDARVGDLVAGITTLGLLETTTFVVISDHGMAALSADRQIYLDDYLDIETVDVAEWGPYAAITPKPGIALASVLKAITGRHPAMTVYPKEKLPAHLHYGTHPRVPPVIALADDEWTITTRGRRPSAGSHGYDPTARSMRGLLIAAGPDLKRGMTVPPVEIVDLYAMMCRVLGLTPAPNDGDPLATAGYFAR